MFANKILGGFFFLSIFHKKLLYGFWKLWTYQISQAFSNDTFMLCLCCGYSINQRLLSLCGNQKLRHPALDLLNVFWKKENNSWTMTKCSFLVNKPFLNPNWQITEWVKFFSSHKATVWLHIQNTLNKVYESYGLLWYPFFFLLQKSPFNLDIQPIIT